MRPIVVLAVALLFWAILAALVLLSLAVWRNA